MILSILAGFCCVGGEVLRFVATIDALRVARERIDLGVETLRASEAKLERIGIQSIGGAIP